MDQPWLTTSDCPVSALELNAAKNRTASATSSTVVNSPSTVPLSITSLITASSEMPSVFACSGICLLNERRTDEPWADHVRPDPVLGAFLSHGLGKPDQPVLGCDIRSFEEGCLLGVHRSHIDDAASIALPIHLAQSGPRGQKCTIEMDGDQLLPVGEFELVQRRYGLDTGIAHEHIDSSECLHRGADSGLDLGFVGHVHGYTEGPPLGGAQLGRRRLGARRIEIGDDDLGTLAGKGAGDLLTDAPCRTSDDSDFVLQTHGTFPSFSFS